MFERKRRTVIAEDHTILREGLRSLLHALNSGYEIVGEAPDGVEAVRCAATFKPDLMLLDLSMPKMNGLTAIEKIKKCSPQTKVLVLTIHKEEDFILEAFRSGADGYCLKDSTNNELERALECVFSGKPYVSPAIGAKVIEGYMDGRRNLKPQSSWDTLTARERQVLKIIGEGYKNREIADYLCISPKTVEKHRSNIISKLDLHSASSLTAYAIEKGIVAK